MSSILHRLAARAMGSTNTLRSAGRLPYAAPRPLVNTVEIDRQDATLETASSTRRYMATEGAERTPMHKQRQSHTSPRMENDGQHLVNEIAPSPPGLLVAQSPTQEQPYADVIQTVAGETHVLPKGFETQIHVNHSATDPIVDEQRTPSLPDNTSPPSLLPLENVVQPPVANTGSMRRRDESRNSAWQSSVEETTEVHVSIGRIEVTAVHEAPPSKRQAPATPKTMTLDEYLARRRRET